MRGWMTKLTHMTVPMVCPAVTHAVTIVIDTQAIQASDHVWKHAAGMMCPKWADVPNAEPDVVPVCQSMHVVAHVLTPVDTEIRLTALVCLLWCPLYQLQ